MIEIQIAPLKVEDLEEVLALWLAVNLKTHGFVSQEHFLAHLPMMREALPKATVLVAKKEDQVVGFLGMEEKFIHGLFVAEANQGSGIGKRLLDEAKKNATTLRLKVYKKNPRAYAFYVREGFQVEKAVVDEAVGEEEMILSWASEKR